MRTPAENAIGSQATSADVPHIDCTGGRWPFSSAKPAGVALERRPSREQTALKLMTAGVRTEEPLPSQPS